MYYRVYEVDADEGAGLRGRGGMLAGLCVCACVIVRVCACVTIRVCACKT